MVNLVIMRKLVYPINTHKVQIVLIAQTTTFVTAKQKLNVVLLETYIMLRNVVVMRLTNVSRLFNCRFPLECVSLVNN